MNPYYVSALLLICLGLGIWLGQLKYTWSQTLLAVATLLIVFRLFLLRVPGLEYQIFPQDWYVMIRPWWGFMLGLFMLGAAAFWVNGIVFRVMSKVAIGLILVVSIQKVTSAASMDHSARMHNYPNPETGWLKQTTGYTCGAASSAMLLYNGEGIFASEGEMANLCGTTQASGSDEFSVRRALRNRLADDTKSVNLEYFSKDELADVPTPCMAVVGIAYQLDHWIVITNVTDQKVDYLDPCCGIKSIPKAEFVKTWKQVAIWID